MTHETYTHELEVQYRDLDTRKHVNHVITVAYFEQAKGQFFADAFGVSLADAPTVVRTLEVDYRAPIGPDQVVEARLGPMDAGETSLAIEYELVASGTVAATGRTVSVYVGGDGEAAPLPAAWRDALAPYAADG